MHSDSKFFLKTSGILLGIFIVMSAILIGLIYASRSSWQDGLKENTQRKLTEVLGREISLGEYVPVKSSITLSSACWKISNSSQYALVLRIQNITGSAPAVFIYKEDAPHADFVSCLLDNGKAEPFFDRKSSAYTINYWENKIPDFFAGEEK